MLREVVESDSDPIRREIASEVLGGRLRMSEICSYSAYQEALHSNLDEVVRHWEAMPEEEFERRLAEGRAFLANLRAEAEQEERAWHSR